MEQDMEVWWWGVVVFGFFVGLMAGWLLCRRFSPARLNRQAREQHEALQKELKDYQQQVSEHFGTSAHLLNQLTEHYKDLHEHLAGSADQLCKDHVVRQRMTDVLLGGNTMLSKKAQDTMEPPKDYAKTQSAVGTLSEQFGVTSQVSSELKPQSSSRD